MAKVTYDYVQETSNLSNSATEYKVGFLSLKNDGDEAIVRIMHDSVESFDLVTAHDVEITTQNGTKFNRKVNCIREPRDPMSVCPLCEANVPVRSYMFIHLIQYTTDENGRIVASPVIWQRPGYYAKDIANLITEWGNISNYIFKIKRNGAAGNKKTTYTMQMANPNVYPSESYPVDAAAFDGYSAVGSIVLDKTADDIREYLATGSFPMANRQNMTQTAAPIPPASVANEPAYNGFVNNAFTTPNMGFSTPSNINTQMPFNNTESQTPPWSTSNVPDRKSVV